MSLTIPRNSFGTLENPPDFLGDGATTVTKAGTRVQLSTTSTACRKVIVTAHEDNTGNIWIGGSTVADGRGKQLVQLQDIEIEIDNLNKVYIDSENDGDGVHYVFIV